MTIEFIEAPPGRVVGKVVGEITPVGALAARSVLPSRGESVVLPGKRAKREVRDVTWKYGKKGLLKIQVLLNPPRRRGRRR